MQKVDLEMKQSQEQEQAGSILSSTVTDCYDDRTEQEDDYASDNSRSSATKKKDNFDHDLDSEDEIPLSMIVGSEFGPYKNLIKHIVDSN